MSCQAACGRFFKYAHACPPSTHLPALTHTQLARAHPTFPPTPSARLVRRGQHLEIGTAGTPAHAPSTRASTYSHARLAALPLSGWDLFSKSGTMFIGERLWNKVAWGKTRSGDTSQRSAAKVRVSYRLIVFVFSIFIVFCFQLASARETKWRGARPDPATRLNAPQQRCEFHIYFSFLSFRFLLRFFSSASGCGTKWRAARPDRATRPNAPPQRCDLFCFRTSPPLLHRTSPPDASCTILISYPDSGPFPLCP